VQVVAAGKVIKVVELDTDGLKNALTRCTRTGCVNSVLVLGSIAIPVHIGGPQHLLTILHLQHALYASWSPAFRASASRIR